LEDKYLRVLEKSWNGGDGENWWKELLGLDWKVFQEEIGFY
jgi:hypothetical protein